jgi:hypothetical protein
MTSREEREARRQARVEAEKKASAAERRRMVLGYIVAGVLGLAVIVGLVIALGSGDDDGGSVDSGDFPEAAHIEPLSGSVNDFEPDDREGTPPPPIEQGDLERAAKDAGCDLRLDLPDEGNTHIQASDKVPDYETSPPTSGDHIVPPRQQADGAYSEQVGDVFAVHALEHGRIAIQYSPDLPEADQLELKGVFDEDPAGMLFFPNADMPYEVAATAWTQLLGCESYEGAATLDAIRAFRATFRGRGPENVPIYLSG